jgi:mono/diheme cytochrome c family protein
MNKRAATTVTALMLALLALGLMGCAHNRPSEKPPIPLQQNLAAQPRYKPQAASSFYDDGLAMRLPVEGTVARGSIRDDSVYFAGKTGRGAPADANPLPISMALLERGRDRYDVFCTPCHGATGDGGGTVIKRGMIAPPSFHEQRLVDTADGHIYDVIANGVRNMPAYKYQIPVEDRWAIVAYFRALQRSQRATLEDVPSDKRQPVQ